MKFPRASYITRVAAFKRKVPAVIAYGGSHYVLALEQPDFERQPDFGDPSPPEDPLTRAPEPSEDPLTRSPETEMRDYLATTLQELKDVLLGTISVLYTDQAPSDDVMNYFTDTLVKQARELIVNPLLSEAERLKLEQEELEGRRKRKFTQGDVHSYDDEEADNKLSQALLTIDKTIEQLQREPSLTFPFLKELVLNFQKGVLSPLGDIRTWTAKPETV